MMNLDVAELSVRALPVVWMLGAVGCIAGMFWMIYRGHKRRQWEAQHPYPEVEPAMPAKRARYVRAEHLGPEQRREVDEYFARTCGSPAADDVDPQVGDVVSVFMLWINDGELVQDRMAARVVWPRETYVRAHMLHTGVDQPMVLDIPRDAIAGVVHLSGRAAAA